MNKQRSSLLPQIVHANPLELKELLIRQKADLLVADIKQN